MRLFRRCAILAVLFVSACRPAAAQQPGTLEARLPEIRIEAARDTESAVSAPFAVAVLPRAQESVALDAGLSLERVLAGLPGVRISDRGHTALGERLLVRGMP